MTMLADCLSVTWNVCSIAGVKKESGKKVNLELAGAGAVTTTLILPRYLKAVNGLGVTGEAKTVVAAFSLSSSIAHHCPLV